MSTVTLAEYDEVVKATTEAWNVFADLTAPQRGEIVRQIGEALREKKTQLGRLISLEMGKIVPEGEGDCEKATIRFCVQSEGTHAHDSEIIRRLGLAVNINTQYGVCTMQYRVNTTKCPVAPVK